MKYLKTFEDTIKDDIKPQIGDYVIINSESEFSEVKNFINNSIGRIVDFDDEANTPAVVEFENIPNKIKFYFRIRNTRSFFYEQIKYFSPNKEECLDMLPLLADSNKYNL